VAGWLNNQLNSWKANLRFVTLSEGSAARHRNKRRASETQSPASSNAPQKLDQKVCKDSLEALGTAQTADWPVLDWEHEVVKTMTLTFGVCRISNASLCLVHAQSVEFFALQSYVSRNDANAETNVAIELLYPSAHCLVTSKVCSNLYTRISHDYVQFCHSERPSHTF